MSDFKEEYILSRQEYGELFSYISDERVHSVYFNGKSLWIDEGNECYPAKEVPSAEFVDKLFTIICNRSKKRIGITNPVLKVSTSEVCFILISDVISTGGNGFIIKKQKTVKRPEAEELIERGICTAEDIKIIEDIVSAGRSFLISGGNKSVRLDLLRHMTKYIAATKRTVTIEYQSELKLASISPGKDVTELKVCGDSIEQTVETAVLLEPKWVLLPMMKKEDSVVLASFAENSISVGAAMGGVPEGVCTDVSIEIGADKKNAVSSYKINRIRY